MKEVARAYFDRSSNKEMASAVAYFQKLGGGIPGNGKVTLSDLRKSLPSHLSDTLEQLDEDGDGKLDFDQVLTVLYMAKNLEGRLRFCNGCQEVLLGPFFSCRLCMVDKGRATFNLCCNCHRRGKVAHEHSPVNLQDHWTIMDRAITAENSLANKDMEDLHEISQSYYQAGSEELQDLAKEFFNSLDTDGDGKITLTEFLQFTKQECCEQTSNPQFFQILDKDGNGTLDFFEVMKLYYIIRSGRPFCDACNCFIPGTFFSCVECFFKKKTTYDLCHGCYKAGKWRNAHGCKTQFMDNYTLLQVARKMVIAQATGVSSVNNTSSSTPSNAGVAQMNTQPSSMIFVHKPQPPPNNWVGKYMVALHSFETALTIGTIAASVCTIL